MTATQQILIEGVNPPCLLERGIDLRLGRIEDVIAEEAAAGRRFNLIIADPPWSYVQKHGQSRADNHYTCLTVAQIAEHISAAQALAPKLVCWVTGPLLGQWSRQELPWGPVLSVGSWHKSGDSENMTWEATPDSGHYGQGYHWAGCAEFVFVYVRGKPYLNRKIKLRNAWTERPGEHSRKPVDWQTQMIKRWSPPGGRILSMYSGLGSTEEAVLRAGEGRTCVGAEVDPERHRDALSLLAQVR